MELSASGLHQQTLHTEREKLLPSTEKSQICSFFSSNLTDVDEDSSYSPVILHSRSLDVLEPEAESHTLTKRRFILKQFCLIFRRCSYFPHTAHNE